MLNLSLAHASVISPLISLSSRNFSISIPSILFLYSLQNFDLSIFSCHVVFPYLSSSLFLFLFSFLILLNFRFVIVSHISFHIPPSPTSSIAILNPFPYFVGFRFEIPLISSLKQIFGVNYNIFQNNSNRRRRPEIPSL